MSTVCVYSIIRDLTKELAKQFPEIKFHEVTSPSEDKLFKNAEIIVGDYDLLIPHFNRLKKLKWLHGTWAGVNILVPYFKKNPPNFILTKNIDDDLGNAMAEYVIANITNYERNLYIVRQNQKAGLWSREGKIFHFRNIGDLTIGILGIGHIGSRIGKILNSFGAAVVGLGRKPSREVNIENDYLVKYFDKTKLTEFLKSCDYVINVLPHTSETAGLLNGSVLKHCQERKAIFINLGRGTIIDESDLLIALKEGWLSAAILDVFSVHPLPADSLLWSTPEVYITPYISCTPRARTIAKGFGRNYAYYKCNREIPSAVDFSRDY